MAAIWTEPWRHDIVDSVHNWGMDSLTVEEVRELVRGQSTESLTAVNDQCITLEEAPVATRMISVIARHVKNGRAKDEHLTVWIVRQENQPEVQDCLARRRIAVWSRV